MCDIDFVEGMAANLEFEAKRAARYDMTYRQEMKRLSSEPKYVEPKINVFQQTPSSKSNDTRLDRIESRLTALEEKVNAMHDALVTHNESNGLFIFNDKSDNVSSGFGIQLSDRQFNELLNQITK